MTAMAQLHKSVTITERLADHVVGLRYEDIPAEVVAKAKDLLVYHLGVGLGGGGSREATLGTRFAARVSGAGGRCSSRWRCWSWCSQPSERHERLTCFTSGHKGGVCTLLTGLRSGLAQPGTG